MRKQIILPVIVLLLASMGVANAPPRQTEPKFELEGIWWFSNLKGTINLGTEVDAKSDLGLTDADFT